MSDVYYRRNLPQIHPEGYPLFITFRLADSLPMEILAKLKAQHERERKSIPTPSPSKLYNIEKRFFGNYDDWLDRCTHGPRWLESENIASIVGEKIHSMNGEHFRLLALCIMPNHVHLLIESIITNHLVHLGKSAKYPVTDALRLLKGSTARACNLKLKRSGQFWSHESYDHYVRNDHELEHAIKYILYNPVKAGLVNDWQKWQFTHINPELGPW